jgi:hypothetical protein
MVISNFLTVISDYRNIVQETLILGFGRIQKCHKKRAKLGDGEYLLVPIRCAVDRVQ